VDQQQQQQKESQFDPSTSRTEIPDVCDMKFADSDDDQQQERNQGQREDDENSEDDADDFSDISDDSDIFHVQATVVATPRTDEDKELAIAQEISRHLRDYPLLPLDGSDKSKQTTFMDVSSGMRLPLLHCGFLGCDWTCNKNFEYHWDAELELYKHLEQSHRKSEGMQNIPCTDWAIYNIKHRGSRLENMQTN
jgi:hypothetical protein